MPFYTYSNWPYIIWTVNPSPQWDLHRAKMPNFSSVLLSRLVEPMLSWALRLSQTGPQALGPEKVNCAAGTWLLPTHSLLLHYEERWRPAGLHADWAQLEWNQALTGVDNSHLTSSHALPAVLWCPCLGDSILHGFQREGPHHDGIKGSSEIFPPGIKGS